MPATAPMGDIGPGATAVPAETEPIADERDDAEDNGRDQRKRRLR